MPDSYDELKYHSLPLGQSHPAYISALSKIAGLDLPPIERWRVLEMGCGDGSNIIPWACDYPEGRFVGVDQAKEPIAEGQALASRLQLANIELREGDLLEWRPEGEFDYIIAHGIYSWVKPEVREQILQICGAALKPLGVAYVSYNALPGCHFRRFAWDLLRFHTRHLTAPADRIAAALDLARRIAGEPPGPEVLQPAVRREMESVLKKDESVLFHDDLSEINEPFYLLDFAARAAAHGLQYLGDADPGRDDVENSPFRSDDWIEARQYGDFLARRRFRETLLCRRGISLDRKLCLDRFRNLFVASQVTPLEIQEDGQQRFELPASGHLTTNHPLVKEMLCRLAALWPGSARISDFPIDRHAPGESAKLLMRLLQGKAVEVWIHPPKIAASVSNRAEASALARAQVAEGYRIITNQRHKSIEVTDEISRAAISLLDGSRTRQELARALAPAGTDPGTIEDAVDHNLAALHRLCLLTG